MSDRLLDAAMPSWHVCERHHRRIAASPEAAWQAIIDLDFGRSPLIRFLFAARGMWAALRGRRQGYRWPDFEEAGFVKLGERPGHELVYGIIGTFWRPTGGIRRDWTADEFAAFAEPGNAKAAWSFEVAADGSGVRVITETRVQGTDAESERAFRRYWRVVGPFSGLIRKEALRLIDRAAA